MLAKMTGWVLVVVGLAVMIFGAVFGDMVVLVGGDVTHPHAVVGTLLFFGGIGVAILGGQLSGLVDYESEIW
jgi:hypothetical protein